MAQYSLIVLKVPSFVSTLLFVVVSLTCVLCNCQCVNTELVQTEKSHCRKLKILEKV